MCGMDFWFVSIVEWPVQSVVQATASRSLSAVTYAQLLASTSRGSRSRIVFNASVAVVRSAPPMQSSALPGILCRILRLQFFSRECRMLMHYINLNLICWCYVIVLCKKNTKLLWKSRMYHRMRDGHSSRQKETPLA